MIRETLLAAAAAIFLLAIPASAEPFKDTLPRCEADLNIGNDVNCIIFNPRKAMTLQELIDYLHQNGHSKTYSVEGAIRASGVEENIDGSFVFEPGERYAIILS